MRIQKFSKKTSTSTSQPATFCYELRWRPIQTLSSSSTRSTSNSISALLRQHAQPNSSTSEKLPSSLSDLSIELRPSSGIETSFTVHSYPRSTHLTGDQESVSSLSSINPSDLPYHALEQTSRPPTPDLYIYPLRFYNQTFNHPRQHLKYHIFPENRINNSLHYSTITLTERRLH